MWNGMKSVAHFHPMDTPQQRAQKFEDWMLDNGRISSVADKAVPGAKETRQYMKRKGLYGSS
ncbi:hypothetical protein [Halobacillus karajensis]|uniref:Uncharacterized protein n=1 Tax=Halobacillus karajensis TaxID=195088 RepID=A0A059NW97_9BACI|nr:hypothetical protein [Halobacillus karajensis]CDQ22610.1 hypothetical protein BN983_00823 [Halobacillus karajensis]CDQ26092.1 hypothetical protein BN981_00303 [Halobacillus karajensis]